MTEGVPKAYTHGEMLPAHGYLELKQPQLGQLWHCMQKSKVVTKDIPAPVAFNCLCPITDRAHTELVAFPAVHIDEDAPDFSAAQAHGYAEALGAVQRYTARLWPRRCSWYCR